ncbi:MAG: hypothetical protein M0Q91_12775 [Methanoregula sp.]|nr:hypothetical protein [Methanoregula sp.]
MSDPDLSGDFQPFFCPVCGHATRYRRKTKDYVCLKCPFSGTAEAIKQIVQKRTEAPRSAESVRFDDIDFRKR